MGHILPRNCLLKRYWRKHREKDRCDEKTSKKT